VTVARSKTDSYLTSGEREALTYLTNLSLRVCMGCLRARRSDCFGPDGQCAWCREEATPELEARLQGDRLLVKRLRAKLRRIRSKGRSNLTKRTDV